MASEDLIESALTSGQAFVLPPAPKEATATDSVASDNVAQPVDTPASISESSEPAPVSAPTDSDSWKEEYEAQVEAWRAQSAEAREKSEKERARWEAIRQEEAAQRKAAGLSEVKEDIPTGLPTHKSPSVPVSETLTSSAVDIQPESNEGSQKWEEIRASASESSFPSMSFPERTQTPSPSALPVESPQPPPPSATLAIFDSSLSTRTRAIALFSALAVNFALPFVNGVMLGFGEIFAKNVVMQWFGWKCSGSVATNVGVGRRERTSVFR